MDSDQDNIISRNELSKAVEKRLGKMPSEQFLNCMIDALDTDGTWHDSFICVTWVIHMCDMTHSHSWHVSFMCVTGLMYTCVTTYSHVWRFSFFCVTKRILTCDMSDAYMWHDSFMCVAWLFHVCDMTPSCVWHDSFMCVTWCLHVCDMTHSYVPWIKCTCWMIFFPVWMIDFLDTGTGWRRRPSGCPCLHRSFSATEPYN